MAITKTRSCALCIYRDGCPGTYPCSYYHPADEEADDEYLQELVESAANEYREAWQDYINDWN